ncbi:hypothetical protein COU57_05655 [Candidatus Pacearchaeota archaeon CG10_big_fil_rev_8_21_14_0_10_32_14]|nr:MAG: hypothetical protein COU57_05655 [Candidatus Pacearchaeota archaeon CG10_big_fil_rev_8_21_14_0_10_32_14]
MPKEGYIRSLVDYFKKNIEKGYNDETLKWALINQGYNRVEIQKAMDIAHQELAEKAPKIVEKPKITVEVVDNQNQIVHFQTKKPFWKRWLGIE